MSGTLDIRARARLRRALYAKPTIIALFVVFCLITSSTWGMYQKSRISLENKEKAEEQVATMMLREKELSQEIVNLSTDRGIDEKIRERFMVAKEGEGVMIIADPKEEKVHTVTVTDE